MDMRFVRVFPTLDTSAFADGDYAGVFQIPGALPRAGLSALLKSLVLIDRNNQKQAMDLLIFNSLPVIASSINAAFDATDANLLKAIGHIHITAADFVEMKASSNAIVTYKNIDLAVDGESSDSADLYFAIIMRGAATYSVAKGIQFLFGFSSK